VVTATVPRFKTSLGPSFPNPFNGTTSIDYTLGARTRAVVGIYDAAGRLVARLDQGERDPGTHRVEWNGRDARGNLVGSGIYFYRLEGVRGVSPRKLVRLK
jgi:flagellar hook assembly protein FlgD